jgi:pyrroloquinoline-quinone synthase
MSLNLSHTSTTVLKPQILDEIDARVARQHLLQHPFYQTWSRGELSLEALRDYAAQYYHHVAAFPTYLSAVHAQTENAEVRRHILSNLIDEEAGAPNHPELWLQFAESLGLDRTEVRQSAQWPATKNLIEDFRSCCSNRGTGVGLAALYAYESQIPAVSEKKIQGLRQHYGFSNPDGYKYFTVHIEADREHAAVEAAQIAQLVDSERRAALEAVEEILAGLYGLLSAVCERHGIATACVN